MRRLGWMLGSFVGVVACSGSAPPGIVIDPPDAAVTPEGDGAAEASEVDQLSEDATTPVEACAITCGGQCTDLTSDVANCGACGNACGHNHPPLVGGGIWTCTESKCAVACPSTLDACDDGCHDLASDVSDCGQCGAKCNGTCKLGSCCAKPEAGSCSHDPCTSGYPLSSSCDGTQGCVAKVCAKDPYCCSMSWDSTCTSEVPTYCAPLQCKC